MDSLHAGFYVTVVRKPGPRQKVGWLLGPYSTNADAETDIPVARALAYEADPFTQFDAFGVSRLVRERLQPGVLNNRVARLAARTT